MAEGTAWKGPNKRKSVAKKKRKSVACLRVDDEVWAARQKL